MWHPDAWCFPDTKLQVSALPNEPLDPMHGWLKQPSINAEKEMDDVEFCYNLRMRMFPPNTFQAIALGKVPEWIKEAGGGFGLQNEEEDDEEDEEAAAAKAALAAAKSKQARGKLEVDQTLLDKAGLAQGEDESFLVEKVQEECRKGGQLYPPDVLGTKTSVFRVRGLPAMRTFLRMRANPDNRQLPITPKLVKDMAAQLGIKGQCENYWYCLFALRYPLAPEWECYANADTRWYLHLPSGKVQSLHPMAKRFREHMHDCLGNEFLWDSRPRERPHELAQFKCSHSSECGEFAVVWCMQCTDYFCAGCFFKVHKSERGKKHWPMPIPGSRYLLRSEVEKFREYIPFLNVGFSNRRRFLATGNQSDKNGSRSGDTWLSFEADTFSNALVQAPRKNWYLKRLNPPRLAPDAEQYYYNFASDVLADEPTHIMSKQHEQKALFLLQKNIRGAVTRRRIAREVAAARVIQKCKVMWDEKMAYGENGKNKVVLQGWYRKFRAKQDRMKLERRVTRCQAIIRGNAARKLVHEQYHGVTCFQAHFRGLCCRRKLATEKTAAITIQRMYRGRAWGRKPVHSLHDNASKIQGMARGVAYREGVRKQERNGSYVQAHFRGRRGRKLVQRMKDSALLIQLNWRAFQARLAVKTMLYDRLDALDRRYKDTMRLKIQNASAGFIQRNWRRHVDQQKVVYLKREKHEAYKRIQTLLVAVFAAAGSLRHHVHPWWRHLPVGLQEVLEQIKGSLQRTIALVPVTGKLANEEIGTKDANGNPKKGLRVASSKHLTYVQPGPDPDLASHLFISVTRHLLSVVPEEHFAATLNWACYAISHQAADLVKEGVYAKESILLGKESPAHPNDTLVTLERDTGMIKHHHDYLMTFSEESLPGMVLHGLPHEDPSLNLRQVFLTAQVLIAMRQTLDTPTLSTDDHLKFQGLDANSGAQLMNILSCEMDHLLPTDLPTKHGTVAALSTQIAAHINEMQPEQSNPKEKAVRKAKVSKVKKEPSGSLAKAKAGKAKAKGKSKVAVPASPKKEDDDDNSLARSLTSVIDIEHPGGNVIHFSRRALMRIVQQMGYFMRDQDPLVEAVLSAERKEPDIPDGGTGMSKRQSRYVSVTDKLFELAYNAKHDHCSFVLAVVLYHMALRALCLRLMYHRAAVAIQTRYRYLRNKGAKSNTLGPVQLIQRCWRGCRASLRILKQESAASKIQYCYRHLRWNRRADVLLQATLRIQRVWLGAIHRKWLRHCHNSATYIQKMARATQVRLALSRDGMRIVKDIQDDAKKLMQKKSTLPDTQYAARTAAMKKQLEKKLKDHAVDNLQTRWLQIQQVRTEFDKNARMAMKGAVQPMRISAFEPMVFALAKMEPKLPPRYGAARSKVLSLVYVSKKELEKILPREAFRRVHAAAKRGRAAVIARRIAKKPNLEAGEAGTVDMDIFQGWLQKKFEPQRF
jgi:hypothetical protein